MIDDKFRKEDMEWLIAQPQFRRFCWRVIQMAGIFSATNGSEQRNEVNLGRRQLGLEILAECEFGQPAQSSDGLPILTLIQVLREEAQQQPQEPKHARRFQRTDEIAEIDDEPVD
jgi:hypothetical protein